MSEQRCASCRFWWRFGDVGLFKKRPATNGICKAAPPSVTRGDFGGYSISFKSVWPETQADDWCGAWQAKP